ncbi:MAG: HlyC/CorC family transporter [Gammaproteobacteria bacterium]
MNDRSWLHYLGQILSREPQDRAELLALLRNAEQRHLMDQHALSMIEGVLQVSEMQVSDIMVPRTEMVLVAHNAKLEECLPIILETGHSRFPVINQETDEVVGILLAKDLLKIKIESNAVSALTSMLRPPVFVPENTKLDRLLQEFRLQHIHMAIVIDEYGSIAGLATIEDILEQIVGDIEDEYDVLDEDDDFIKKYSATRYVLKATTPLEDFNHYFGSQFEGFETLGDLLLSRFAHTPTRGEMITLDPYRFKVLHADSRQIRLLSLLIRKRGAYTI